MRRKPSALVLVSMFLLACTQPTTDKQELLVFAASSLTDAVTEIESSFERSNRDIDVLVSYAGSSALRGQIVEGAPAAVFAAASGPVMDQIVEAELNASTPKIFATNQLQIVVPAGNPGNVEGLQDLANPRLLVGLCAAGVPCGDSAREALSRAGVEPSVDSFEPDVRALLTKVEAGELDVGIVYTTDVRAASDGVTGIALPAEFNVLLSYPIATLVDAPDVGAAQRFVDFVLSDAGQSVLRGYGFGPP